MKMRSKHLVHSINTGYMAIFRNNNPVGPVSQHGKQEAEI